LLIILISTGKKEYLGTVDPTLITDQRKFRAKYLQNGEEN